VRSTLDEEWQVSLHVPVATVAFENGAAEIRKIFAPQAPPPQYQKEAAGTRRSVFDRVSLRSIEIERAVAATVPQGSNSYPVIRAIVIAPQEQVWVLTGTADRGLFQTFSCPAPSSTDAPISLSMSRHGLGCLPARAN
jgi:hypothetical protein